jgi:hypothetical protein
VADLHSATEIGAPPSRVWGILTDAPSFDVWNPTLRDVSGELAPGARLRMRLQLGRRRVTVRPHVTRFEPDRELVWVNHPVPLRLVRVERGFTLEPLPTSRTRLLQWEVQTGPLAGLVRRLLGDRIVAGFDALGSALKSRAEADEHGPARSAGATEV